MLRLGIIGTGRIANRFVTEVEQVSGIRAVMVYNPHPDSAERFAQKYNIAESTTQIEVLTGKIDAAYIATPHQTHYEYAKWLLQNGIHVLCEKPLVFSKEQAEELFALAQEKQCVLMEAIKTAYCPGFRGLLEVLQNGAIGEIVDVEAAFTRLPSEEVRETKDLEYGGSFTEYGTYSLLAILKIMGMDYRELSFRSIYKDASVDIYTKAFLKYERGMGTAKTGLGVKSEGQLLVSGTKGYLLAESPWWLTKKIEIRYEDPNQKEVYTYEFDGQGLRYELEAFVRRINGENVALGVNSEESIELAAIMEKFQRERVRR